VRLGKRMAKSDSFFIRAQVSTDGTNFAQESIDLGAYVDALGKSVLRIHNIAVMYGAPNYVPPANVSSSNVTSFQLTTQSQTASVGLNDKSAIATGKLLITNDSATPALSTEVSEVLDMAPQHFTNGYLVGVEQIYLGCDQTFDQINQISIVMECTVETLSQNAAMALALSQQ
jgi:hypothetical protein